MGWGGPGRAFPPWEPTQVALGLQRYSPVSLRGIEGTLPGWPLLEPAMTGKRTTRVPHTDIGNPPRAPMSPPYHPGSPPPHPGSSPPTAL